MAGAFPKYFSGRSTCSAILSDKAIQQSCPAIGDARNTRFETTVMRSPMNKL